MIPISEESERKAAARMYATMFALALGGTLAALAWKGAGAAAGFLLGAVASLLNFRWLKQLTDTLGGVRKPRKRLVFWLAFRYALFGGGGYVIFKYSEISLAAALLGLLVAVAGVILEILYELIYART